MSGVLIVCACCGIIFEMCRQCYRGHAYCSDKCREEGYRERRREAQRNYRKKEKGKIQHRNAEARRRKRKKHTEKKKTNTIINFCICTMLKVEGVLKNISLIMKKGRCIECNCHINNFLEFIDIRA